MRIISMSDCGLKMLPKGFSCHEALTATWFFCNTDDAGCQHGLDKLAKLVQFRRSCGRMPVCGICGLCARESADSLGLLDFVNLAQASTCDPAYHKNASTRIACRKKSRRRSKQSVSLGGKEHEKDDDRCPCGLRDCSSSNSGDRIGRSLLRSRQLSLLSDGRMPASLLLPDLSC